MEMRVPFQNHSATSHEAARFVNPKVSAMERRILELLGQTKDIGGVGLTDEELIDVFGSQSARPRRIFLTHIGKVVDSGTTRKTRSGRRAVVWRLA